MWIVSCAWECPIGYLGGLGTVVSRLIPALGRYGKVVHICTEGSRRFSYGFCGALVYPCSQTVVNRDYTIGFSEGLVLSSECFRIGVGADVVVAHDHHSAPCVLALSEQGVKTVYFSHLPYMMDVEVAAALKASRFVVNSLKTAKMYEQFLGKSPSVVYLPSPYRVVERRRPFRKRTRILIFTRFQPLIKDPSWFLEHLDKLWRRMNGGFSVTLAGKGTELLDKKYPWMEVLGSVSEQAKIKLYAESDLLIHPLKFDPYGLVPLEAISLGAPALVSSGAGVSEVLKTGVFDVEKPDEAVELLAQYIGEPRLLEELLSKQRESDIFKKTWLNVAEELLAGAL